METNFTVLDIDSSNVLIDRLKEEVIIEGNAVLYNSKYISRYVDDLGDLTNIIVNKQVLKHIYITKSAIDKLSSEDVHKLVKLHRFNQKLKMLGYKEIAYLVRCEYRIVTYDNKIVICILNFVNKNNKLPKKLIIDNSVKDIILEGRTHIDELEEIVLPDKARLIVASKIYQNIILNNIENITEYENRAFRDLKTCKRKLRFNNITDLEFDIIGFKETKEIEFNDTCNFKVLNIYQNIDYIKLNNSIIKINLNDYKGITIFTPRAKLVVDDRKMNIESSIIYKGSIIEHIDDGEK